MLLRQLPVSMDPLIHRLEGMSYTVLSAQSEEFQKMTLATAPAVAILPLSARATLDQLQRGILMFQSRFKDAQTTYIGIYSGRLPISESDLHRIGINSVYQTPFEDELVINKIYELAPGLAVDAKELTLDHLIRVNIAELERAENLPFDLFLYLPMNRRVILYLEKGHRLDEKTIKKFQEHGNYNLYIRRADIKAYQNYGRTYVTKLAPGEALGKPETSKKIAGRIGGLLGEFFSDATLDEVDAKQIIENLKAFVSDVKGPAPSKEALEKEVGAFAAQKMTSASHCQNTAAYCALFGLALGLSDAEALRMGGLLHDIGIADLAPELSNRDMPGMTASELAKYRQHPKAAEESLSKRKLTLPKEARDMILYHHEHTDGSGYPFGKKGADIPPYAKVCAFADEFDKLTSIRPGFPQLTPVEAMKRIAGLDGKPPSPIYDPGFHAPLIALFVKPVAKPTVKPAGVTVVDTAPASASGKAPSQVTLTRLLKTPDFSSPSYLPNVNSTDARKQDEFEAIAEQLQEHFSRWQKLRANADKSQKP